MDAEAQAGNGDAEWRTNRRPHRRGGCRADQGLLVGFVLLTALATNQLFVLSAHTDA
jgi:hypothetical protein